MTTEEVLAYCQGTIGRPLNRMQTRIGFPRETSIGGPLFHKLAEVVAQEEPDFPRGDSPTYYQLSKGQIKALGRELGRFILNSGDVLFGKILVCLYDKDDQGSDTLVKDVRSVLKEQVCSDN